MVLDSQPKKPEFIVRFLNVCEGREECDVEKQIGDKYYGKLVRKTIPRDSWEEIHHLS